MIDEGTEFGARVARRLRQEMVVWLTTVTPAGAPLPRPVGFLWDGGEVVSIYSQPGARVRNIAANPKVALNFDGDGRGGDVVVLSGTAQVDPDAPAADANPAHLEKYAARIERFGMTPASYAARFSVPVRTGSRASTAAEAACYQGDAAGVEGPPPKPISLPSPSRYVALRTPFE